MANDLRTRSGVVAGLLVEALGSVPAQAAGERPTVLDCGGGSGTFAVPLAQAGATVTVIDISVDALSILAKRAGENGVADHVEGVQGDVESLAEVMAGRQFDVVLAHGILEVLDDPAAVFAAMVGAVRPGGVLSILVNNPVAAVLSRALGGDLAAALHEFGELDAATRVGADRIRSLCDTHGLTVEALHGVGVFTDFVPGTAIDQPGARDALAQLEALGSTRVPFADIAGRQHLLVRRPAG